MKPVTEIGGYIELDRWEGSLLHDRAAALNCGRNCLAYLIEAKKIRAILLPYFLCTSVAEVCISRGVRIRYYHVGESFIPELPELKGDEWLYLVNYYGCLTAEKIRFYKENYSRVIVDNAQAYFDAPVPGVDTLYTCRKYFGVPDGAFLYTDTSIGRKLPEDRSKDRMNFLLGRFEGCASDYYEEYAANNKVFRGMEIRSMSELTANLLRRIDYAKVKSAREANYARLEEHFKGRNPLTLGAPEGPFAYPLYAKNAPAIRKALAQEKIYIPLLWPNVAEDAGSESRDADYAMNILPLPCDQRYDPDTMDHMASRIEAYL